MRSIILGLQFWSSHGESEARRFLGRKLPVGVITIPEGLRAQANA